MKEIIKQYNIKFGVFHEGTPFVTVALFNTTEEIASEIADKLSLKYNHTGKGNFTLYR